MTSGFGLERLGLITLRYPRTALALVAAVSVLLFVVSLDLKFSSDIREIFRSDDPQFSTLERMTEQYPGGERDIFLLVEGDIAFDLETLETLRNLHLDLRFVEGVDAVLSFFSARRAPVGGGSPELLFPDEMDQIGDLEVLRREVLAHPLVAGKLLSADLDLAVFVITLDDQERSLENVQLVVGEIRDTAAWALDGSSLSADVAGLPVIRIEIIGALQRDQVVFKIVGVLLGLTIAWVFFRNFRYVIVTGLPVLVAITWLLGVMQLMGEDIDVLNNVVPTLVMVITFSDGLHLVFAIRRKRGRGVGRDAAIAEAVNEVGPACVLTSITTALALSSLVLVPHQFISDFAILAAAGTLLAFLATIMTLPPLARLVLREDLPVSESAPARTPWTSVVSVVCADLAMRRPVGIALTGVVILGVTMVFYMRAEPHYLYRDNLPANSAVERATQAIDDKLAGTAVLRVFLQWPEGHDMLGEETLAAISAAHEVVAAEPAMKQVWSLRSISDWFATGSVQQGGRAVAEIIEQNSSALAERALSLDHHSALITAQYADMPAADLIPIARRIEVGLADLSVQYPQMTASANGIALVAARMSHQMITQLNRSLLVAIAVIIVLIGLALRSASAALVSILPNLLPLAVGGTYLYFTGAGLQFTSVIAFTVGFGIAVDSTIHLLNRYRIERGRAHSDEDPLRETVVAIGPVLIMSTVVLTAGLGVTLTSAMQMVQLFGFVSAVVLASALVGDMLFLPAILKLVSAAGRIKAT
jgi:hypothetical protein